MTMTQAEWMAEGKRLFGEHFKNWRFVCPVCKNVASVGDFEQFKGRGADPNSATCECIGRYMHAGERTEAFGTKPTKAPCNYCGYGLFRLSPIRVVTESGKEVHAFAFDGQEIPA